MIQEFQVKVYGDRKHIAEEEMDEITSSLLILFRMHQPNSRWECVEDVIMPDPAWIPGVGPKGDTQGFKAFRKFLAMRGGDEMDMTPVVAEEKPPEQEIVDNPEEEQEGEAPKEDDEQQDTPAEEAPAS